MLKFQYVEVDRWRKLASETGLTFEEPHMLSDVAGIYHPSPAIRFSRAPCGVPPQTPRVAEGAGTASQIINWLV